MSDDESFRASPSGTPLDSPELLADGPSHLEGSGGDDEVTNEGSILRHVAMLSLRATGSKGAVDPWQASRHDHSPQPMAAYVDGSGTG